MGSAAEDAAVDETVPVFTAQDVPSSDRSRGIVARVAPRLIRDLNEKGLSYGSPVVMRIFKEEWEFEIWVQGDDGFEWFRTYDIAKYSGRLGPKLQEGDRQAPEGFYDVYPGQMNPLSRHQVAFDIGFPNEFDRAHGRTGSYIMVHGGRSSIGCYAMTDAKVEEIWTLADAALRNGQPFIPVHCFPFRMAEENMQRHEGSEWYAFWENLKEGYDHFERSRRPPNVLVRGGVYVFEEDGDTQEPAAW